MDPSPSNSNDRAQFRQALKALHHPNILDLYGFNLKGSAGEQFLVYEYAANGTLDSVLKDEGMRARLPARMRLSIMYQVARTVHFLHTGGAGFKVLHRDIKSATIYLTKDFAPRLIVCGQATYVEDEHNAFPSQTTKQTGSTEGPAIGHIGNTCPEYTTKEAQQIECDYIPAAFDVYSIGLVMAELIIGHVNGDPTNVFETYVLNGKSPVVDGWKRLKRDADNKFTWNAGALELVCKTAIGCITPSPEERLSTGALLPLLHHAIAVNAGESDGVQDEDIDDVIAKFSAIESGNGISAVAMNARESFAVQDEVFADVLTTLSAIKSVHETSSNTINALQNYALQREYVDNLIDKVRALMTGNGRSDPNVAGRDLTCSVCNELPPVVKCWGVSHLVCAACIDDAVVNAPASTTAYFQLPCLIDRCSSQPFTSVDLYRHVHVDVWKFHWMKKRQRGFNEVEKLQKKT
jgi:serine/threonine protein kinase